MRAREFPDDLPRGGPAATTLDGRNVDPALGTLSGEGAEQRVSDVFAHPAPLTMTKVPADAIERAHDGPSYYGAPLLKEPVWQWYIPAYFYVGGVAGAAAALGAATQVLLGRETPGLLRRRPPAVPHRLVRRCRAIAMAGSGVSAALLIADLGRPARFLNMLRVFRPTSPMNMGTWVLSAFGGLSAISTFAHVAPVGPALRRAGDLAAVGAGAIGLPLCTYTGVLIANTAVPIWQGTRRTLPVLFGASGAAGAAALLELWPPGGEGSRIVRRFGLLGKSLELGLTLAFEREAGQVARVARPLRSGASAALWRASQALSAAGLLASLVSTRRGVTRAAGVLGTLGALAIRFAVVRAGHSSARDPYASFEQQRAGRGAADVVKHVDERGKAAPLGGPDPGMEQAGGLDA